MKKNPLPRLVRVRAATAFPAQKGKAVLKNPRVPFFMRPAVKKNAKVLAGVLTCLFFGAVAHVGIGFLIVFGDKTHCSFPRQLRRAEIVVADAGGSAVLASEAAKVLELALANEGNNDFLLFRELPSISPVLHRARQSLPHDASLWAVKKPRRHYASTNSQPRLRGMEIPAHVVIRYGTHSTYVWMLVFPPGNTLPELPDGVAHVEGTVYLSKRNL